MPASHCSVFLQDGCPSCRPTNSVKALKADAPMQMKGLARYPKTEPLELTETGFTQTGHKAP